MTLAQFNKQFYTLSERKQQKWFKYLSKRNGKVMICSLQTYKDRYENMCEQCKEEIFILMKMEQVLPKGFDVHLRNKEKGK